MLQLQQCNIFALQASSFFSPRSNCMHLIACYFFQVQKSLNRSMQCSIRCFGKGFCTQKVCCTSLLLAFFHMGRWKFAFDCQTLQRTQQYNCQYLPCKILGPVNRARVSRQTRSRALQLRHSQGVI